MCRRRSISARRRRRGRARRSCSPFRLERRRCQSAGVWRKSSRCTEPLLGGSGRADLHGEDQHRRSQVTSRWNSRSSTVRCRHARRGSRRRRNRGSPCGCGPKGERRQVDRAELEELLEDAAKAQNPGIALGARSRQARSSGAGSSVPAQASRGGRRLSLAGCRAPRAGSAAYCATGDSHRPPFRISGPMRWSTV